MPTPTPTPVTLPSYVDGGRVAFHSNRDGNNEIYVMGCDGASPTRLTNNSAEDKEPSWAKGGKLAFSSNRNSDGGFDIYLLTLSPWGLERLTTSAAKDESPALSPDGTKLAFVSDRDGDAEIHVLTLSDKSVTQITSNTHNDKDPDWSSDGTKIVFASDRDGDWDVFIANADGSSPTNLTDSPSDDSNKYDDRWPSLAKADDGYKYISFSTNRDGQWKLYTMLDDASDTWKTTDGDGDDTQSSWGPSVDEIVYQTYRDENYEVYTTFDAGGFGDNLTLNKDSDDSSPDWEPLDKATYCYNP